MSVSQIVCSSRLCHPKIYDRRFLFHRFSFFFPFLSMLLSGRASIGDSISIRCRCCWKKKHLHFNEMSGCSFNRPKKNSNLPLVVGCLASRFEPLSSFLIFEGTYLNGTGSGREDGRQDKKKKIEGNGMNTQQEEKSKKKREKERERGKKKEQRHGGCVG